MARQHWPATARPARGRLLLIHGLSSIADSWWRIGPALAARGWDATAVDQAGHGGDRVAGDVTPRVLADAVSSAHPVAPDVLIGHSLGTVTALALLERDPGWADTLILEEPPSLLEPGQLLRVAENITADVDAVRADRAAVVARVRRDAPRWAEEDVHWAVQGIAEMDAPPFARWLRDRAADERLREASLADRILGLAPHAHVLAGEGDRGFFDGGSVLGAADRAELGRRLPAGHVIGIEGGHCLHRDAPEEWLAAVVEILG